MQSSLSQKANDGELGDVNSEKTATQMANENTSLPEIDSSMVVSDDVSPLGDDMVTSC